MPENAKKKMIPTNKMLWNKIYQHGHKHSPTRGWVREEYVSSNVPGIWYFNRATVIGYREMNIQDCVEDMAARVRFWALYFNTTEVSEIMDRPLPYDTEPEMTADNIDRLNVYYKYYFENMGKLVGIVATKKEAYEMADILFEQRRRFVEERQQALDHIYDNASIVGLTVDGLDDLPYS